jgi:predicted DNA-binding transcriptional regulator YafY
MSILIMSERESDLSRILMESADCKTLTFSEAEAEELSHYSALAILAGVENAKPKTLSAALRIKIEDFAETRKPVF